MELCTDKGFIEKFKTKTILTFPRVHGCYSTSGEKRTYSPDAKQLKYWNKYCPDEGKVCFNLDDHPENNIREDPEQPPEYLNNLLKYIMTHKIRFVDIYKHDAISLSEAPILCSRALLRTISSLPYIFNESITIYCCLYRGVIYLYYEKIYEYNLNDTLLKGIDWGFKFEQYMLAGKLNKHKILFYK